MSCEGTVIGAPLAGFRMLLRTEHENLRLQNGGIAQRQVYGHLVAVEVGVECRTCQRMELQGLAFDELRLEGLDTEAVQGRGSGSSVPGALLSHFRGCPR